jgi:hypothetical protein
VTLPNLRRWTRLLAGKAEFYTDVRTRSYRVCALVALVSRATCIDTESLLVVPETAAVWNQICVDNDYVRKYKERGGPNAFVLNCVMDVTLIIIISCALKSMDSLILFCIIVDARYGRNLRGKPTFWEGMNWNEKLGILGIIRISTLWSWRDYEYFPWDVDAQLCLSSQ